MKFLLHAGLEKTATTMIQKRLYPTHHVVVLKNDDSHDELNITYRNLIKKYRCDDYDERRGNLLTVEIGRAIAERLTNSDDPILIISDERLTSFDRYHVDIVLQHIRDMVQFVAEALDRKIETHVLITVRRPSDWMLSHFAYHNVYWRSSGVKNLSEFVKFAVEKPYSKALRCLEMQGLMKKFGYLFETQNLRILSYETLNSRPEKFIEHCSDFFGNTFDTVSPICQVRTNSIIQNGARKAIVSNNDLILKRISKICGGLFKTVLGKSFSSYMVSLIKKKKSYLSLKPHQQAELDRVYELKGCDIYYFK